MNVENNLKDKKQIKFNSLLIFFLLIILLILSLFFCVKNRVGRYKNDYYSQIINNQENAIKIEINEVYNMIKGIKKITEFDADITQKYFIYETIIYKDEKYFDATCLIIKNDPYVKVYINNEVEKVLDVEEFAVTYMGIIKQDEYFIEELEEIEKQDDIEYLKKCKYKDIIYEVVKKKNVMGQYDIFEVQFKKI